MLTMVQFNSVADIRGGLDYGEMCGLNQFELIEYIVFSVLINYYFSDSASSNKMTERQ